METEQNELYEAPTVQIVAVNTEGFLCASIVTRDDDWEAPLGDNFDEE